MHDPGESRFDSLVRRFHDGDDEAFRTLVDDTRVQVHAAMAKVMPGWLGRRLSVADLVQDACIVAHRRRADFHGETPSSFRRWLLGIARMNLRRAIQHHAGKACRDARRERSQGARPDTTQFVGHGEPSPSQIAMGQEASDLLERALASLSQDRQQVLRLLRQERLTVTETARRMERSEAAVRKLQGRALLDLSDAFEQLRRERHA